MKNRLLFLLLLTTAVSCTQKPTVYPPVPYPLFFVNETYFQEKYDLYRSLQIERDDIVMVGDDLMDRGVWDSFFQVNNIKNRGIATETSECTKYRIDSLCLSRPRKLFISTGANDLKRQGKSASEVLANLTAITMRARSRSMVTELYLIPPIPDSVICANEELSAAVDSIHNWVKKSAERDEYFQYIDLRPNLCDSNGVLRKSYTYDGQNLNGAGYVKMAQTLEPFIGHYAMNKPDTLDYPQKHPYYRQRVSILNSLPIIKYQAIMLGNSLTNNGEWNELIPNFMVSNMGVSGDVTDGMNLRLGRIVEMVPSSLFLMIGVNDFINDSTKTPTNVWRSILSSISVINQKLPQTELFVLSVLPINPKSPYYQGRNDKISTLNSIIASFSKRYRYTYIDLASLLQDHKGDLDGKYTFDGIHLNAAAYRIWADCLEYYLQGNVDTQVKNLR